jgi:hypothetical protein
VTGYSCWYLDLIFKAITFEFTSLITMWGHVVAQLVEALFYKPEDRWFDSRWCHLNFSLT